MNPKIATFSLDDFQIGNALENLQRIKNHFPKFKCTMFMIPMNISIVTGDMEEKKYKEWAALLKEYDWIELALHGFAHMEGEGDVKTLEDAETLVKGAENTMTYFGLPFAKIWKSPYWISSEILYEYLKKNDYIVALDPAQPIPEIKLMKIYQHNWSIDKSIPEENIIKAHGHCYGTNNDITACLSNVLSNLPTDAEFKFISEFYAENPSFS